VTASRPRPAVRLTASRLRPRSWSSLSLYTTEAQVRGPVTASRVPGRTASQPDGPSRDAVTPPPTCTNANPRPRPDCVPDAVGRSHSDCVPRPPPYRGGRGRRRDPTPATTRRTALEAAGQLQPEPHPAEHPHRHRPPPLRPSPHRRASPPRHQPPPAQAHQTPAHHTPRLRHPPRIPPTRPRRRNRLHPMPSRQRRRRPTPAGDRHHKADRHLTRPNPTPPEPPVTPPVNPTGDPDD
jgi:hypothetical protein